MSIEQLLFFLLLVAIPLLERLIRAMQTRRAGSSGEQLPATDGTVSRSRGPVSIRETGATAWETRGAELPLAASPLPPALPKAIPHPVPEQLRASERAPRLREPKHVPATSRRTGQSERPLAPRRIAAGDLRQAMVLIAVLGPCRALEPKDVSQLSS
jgi:hypothetical protein